MDRGWKKGIHLLWWIKFEPRTVTWRLLNVDETQDFYLFYYYSISPRKFQTLLFSFLENFFRSRKKKELFSCKYYLLLEKSYLKFWNSIRFAIKNRARIFMRINYELMKCYRNRRGDVWRRPVCSSRVIVYGNFLHVSRCETWS